MVGQFKQAPGGHTHLLVAVDKFTKWIEAKPITKCGRKTATKFIYELIYRYTAFRIASSPTTTPTLSRVPSWNSIVSKTSDSMWHQSPILSRTAKQSAPTRASSTGLKPGLQVPLERAVGCWVKELPSFLWGLRTLENRSTRFTPFFMVYNAEAAMPTDLQYHSPSMVNYTKESNEFARQNGLDLVDEAHDLACSRTAIYCKSFAAITVPESALAPSKRATSSSPWQGPFAIRQVLGNDSYYLVDIRGDGKLDVQRP
jgi:hypothetical protein